MSQCSLCKFPSAFSSISSAASGLNKFNFVPNGHLRNPPVQWSTGCPGTAHAVSMRKQSEHCSFPPLMASRGRFPRRGDEQLPSFHSQTQTMRGITPASPHPQGDMGCRKHVGPSSQLSVIPSHGLPWHPASTLKFSFLLDESQCLSSSILGLSFSPQSSPWQHQQPGSVYRIQPGCEQDLTHLPLPPVSMGTLLPLINLGQICSSLLCRIRNLSAHTQLQ